MSTISLLYFYYADPQFWEHNLVPLEVFVSCKREKGKPEKSKLIPVNILKLIL